jgi:hypothetical protein
MSYSSPCRFTENEADLFCAVAVVAGLRLQLPKQAQLVTSSTAQHSVARLGSPLRSTPAAHFLPAHPDSPKRQLGLAYIA